MSKLTLTFLGTGTSQGVPVIGCQCPVCLSSDPKDNRLRTSVMISYEDSNIVIDTGPDFRLQMLNNKVQTLEAVVFTHAHKDHIAGLDDIRPFNFMSKKDMEVYSTSDVLEALSKDYHYIFDPSFSYPGIPRVKHNLISKSDTFQIADKKWTPIEVMHYKLPVLGYRIDDLVYITDANYISDHELEKIKGCKTLVINALRREKHISHFTLEEAIELSNQIQPERTYLTHVSHLMGLHEEVSLELPPNIHFAFDGLKIEC